MSCSSPTALSRGLSSSTRDNPVFDEATTPHSARIRAHHLEGPSQPPEASFSSFCGIDLAPPGSPQHHAWKVLEGNARGLMPAHRALAADTREHMRAIKHELRALQQHTSPRGMARSASASGGSLASVHNPFAVSLLGSEARSGAGASLSSLQQQVHGIMQGQYELARELRLAQVCFAPAGNPTICRPQTGSGSAQSFWP